jgi:uncharacterized protein involved in exopolysaccharide biosynthesis
LLSPAQYQATARIEINPDVTDINQHGQGMSHDPYFIQTEFEVLQSQAVLGKVINALNLNVEWGKKYAGGAMLTTNESFAILKQHLNLAIERNPKLIEISFTSEDPNEAARIANAIAEAYQDYRLEKRNQETLKGIEVLQQKYQDEEEKIQIQQTNVDLLREKYKINKDDEFDFDNGGTTFSPIPKPKTPKERELLQKEYERTKPFWDEKRKLSEMIVLHKLLQAKIAAEKLDIETPKTTMVQIMDLAQPPKSPAGPNRFLGAALLAIGLFPAAGGFLLLKSSRHHPCPAS